jgi:hypothetical protein
MQCKRPLLGGANLMKDRNRDDPGWVHTYRKLLDMQPILLKPIIHHGEEQVGIFFPKTVSSTYW